MFKNILLAASLTLLPPTQPLEARSSFGPEALAIGLGVVTVAALSFFGWRAQNNFKELAQREQLYQQEQLDKSSINDVLTIEPTKDIYEITQLFEQAHTTGMPFEHFVAEYCSYKALSIDALCSNLASYTNQTERSFTQLKTNYELWNATKAPLAQQAYTALSEPRLQQTINTLKTMCQSLYAVKDYAHIYCAYKQIATKAYPYDSSQFPLLNVVNEMNSDLEILSGISYKLSALNGYDHDTYGHRIELAHALGYTISDLIAKKDNIVTTGEYQQQKTAHFILQQKQDEADRVYRLEKERLAQAKKTDEQARDLEQQRVNLERSRIENERKSLDLKSREWDELKATIKKLRDEIQQLTYDKKAAHASLDDLRLELARLKEKYAALKKERSAGPAS